MEIKGILFDKDGTLINFEETFGPATEIVLQELSVGQPDVFVRMANAWSFDAAAKKFAPDSIVIAASGYEMAEAIAPALQRTDVSALRTELDEMYGEASPQFVKPLPGALEALEQLDRAGIRLGIATNDSEINAVNQMKILGIDHLFAAIFGADSGHGAKPGPGMVEAFMKKHGFLPQEVMMVGDSLHDMEAGLRAGSRTVAVETGPATRADLEGNCDLVLASVVDLVALTNSA